MITTPITFKVKKSGNGRQGYLTLPARISNTLGWKEQNVTIMLLAEGENPTEEEIKEQIKKAKELNDMDAEVEKMKKVLMG